jgi:O-antigen/teichoic acid export membrane protein
VIALLTRAMPALRVLAGGTKLRQMDPESSRGHERHRRMWLAAATSVLSRALQIVFTLVSVPLTLHYLGQEGYGLWMTLTSAVGMLAFADFGLGNGLLNLIASAHGRKDRAAAREAASTAFFLLAMVATVMAALFVASKNQLSWTALFNVQAHLRERDVQLAVGALMACFALSMPLGTVQRIQLGYQEGFASNLWQALGSALGFAGLILAIRLRLGLASLLLANAGGPVIALALNALTQFGFVRPWLRPSLSSCSLPAARQLVHTGGLFFAAQLGTMLLLTAPNLVIARIIGAHAVAPYTIVMKPIQALVLLTSLWALPLWPAYGEASARGDWTWIRRTFYRTLLGGVLISAIAGALFFASHRWVLSYWVGDAIVPSRLTVGSACLFLLAHSVRWTGSMCLNGVGRLKGQVVYQGAAGLAAIGIAVPFASLLGLGGIALSFALGEIVVGICIIIEVVFLLRHMCPGIHDHPTEGDSGDSPPLPS